MNLEIEDSKRGNGNSKIMNEIETLLNAACDGLIFLSETDAPLTPFFWPAQSETPTPDALLKLAQLPADSQVKTTRFETFFAASTREETWQNAEEKAEVARFKNLVQTLKTNLQDIKVFRVNTAQNEAAFDVFVVGQTEIAGAKALAGVRTKVVET